MQTRGMLATAVVGLFLTFDIFAIELGSFSTARFDTGWTLNGGVMEDTRAKLLNPENFGPEGTVPEAVNITDVSGEITYTALSPFNIFFAGYLSDNAEEPITENEGQAFFDWVSDGGTLIITCDDAAHDSLCIAFGLSESDVADPAVPPVVPTASGSTRQIFDGPFGVPTELAMAGNMPYYADTGGFSVLAEDQVGTAVLTAFHCGSIRIAFDPSAEYEALGYSDLEYDFTRLATPLAPCPVALPAPLL